MKGKESECEEGMSSSRASDDTGGGSIPPTNAEKPKLRSEFPETWIWTNALSG